MKNVGGNNNDGKVPNANIETKPTPADLKTINSTGVEEVENTTYNPDEDIDDPLLASIDNFTEDMKSVNGQIEKGYNNTLRATRVQ